MTSPSNTLQHSYLTLPTPLHYLTGPDNTLARGCYFKANLLDITTPHPTITKHHPNITSLLLTIPMQNPTLHYHTSPSLNITLTSPHLTLLYITTTTHYHNSPYLYNSKLCRFTSAVHYTLTVHHHTLTVSFNKMYFFTIILYYISYNRYQL